MSLAGISIRNPVFAWMLMFGFIVFGLISFDRLPVGQYPDVDFPIISISATLEGAAPEIMETDVVDVLEDAVMAVEGIREITSTCRQGTASVSIEFDLSRDIDLALQDVQARVSQATRKLPRDMDPITINKTNPEENPFMWVAVSGARPQTEISEYAKNVLRDRFLTVEGNGEVMMGGYLDRNLRVWIDAKKLEQLGISVDELLERAQAEHVDVPAGRLESGMIESNLAVEGEALNAQDLMKIVVAVRNGVPVYLKDVALIEDGFEDRRRLARVNGLPAQGLGIIKQHGANTVAVADEVRKRVGELRKQLPEGMNLDIRVDNSKFIRDSINEMKSHVLLAVALTALVCWLFLGSLSSTFNVILAIPVSLFGTLAVMHFMGFSLNTFTLLALTLSIGIVVDDAVMVLENIYRHAEMGKDKVRAAKEGTEQITSAALAATLAIIAIFLPVAFMTGIIGKYFFQFGVVLSVAVAISLLEALTIAPARCSQFLAVGHRTGLVDRAAHWMFDSLAALYRAVLRVALQFRSAPLSIAFLALFALAALGGCIFAAQPVLGLFTGGWQTMRTESLMGGAAMILSGLGLAVLLPGLLAWAVYNLFHPRRFAVASAFVLTVSAALFALSMEYVQTLPKEMVPAQDTGNFIVRIIGPTGANLEYMDRVLREVEEKLEVYPEIEGVFAVVGAMGGDVNTALTFITLHPMEQRKTAGQLSQQQLIARMRTEIESNPPPGCRVVIQDLSQTGFAASRRGGSALEFSIRGPDWEKLGEQSDLFIEEMRATGKFGGVDTTFRKGMPEVQVIPNREKAMANNVDMRTLANTVSLLVGGQRIAYYKRDGRRYDIRARLQHQDRERPEDIGELFIRSRDGRLVRIREVASVVTRPTLQQITRLNRERAVTLSTNPATGVSQGDAMLALEKLAEKLPEGYRMEFSGTSKTFRESFDSLLFALVLGLIVAYMVLASQFNSFIHPVTILLALPFSVTGALLALHFTGQSLNIYSMIGLVLLMGIVKKNSILLVDYTNQLREDGKSREDALIEACPTRLRPILMTTLATIASAVPGALLMGPGGELRVPMSMAIIGGLTVSTLLTLIVVPCFYHLVDEALQTFFPKKETQPEAPAAVAAHAGE